MRCHPKGCAATRKCASLVQHLKASEQAREDTSPRKINVTSKSPVGDISVVTLIRTDTTLDHSQKAEKVWTTHTVAHCLRITICNRVMDGWKVLQLYSVPVAFGFVSHSHVSTVCVIGAFKPWSKWQGSYTWARRYELLMQLHIVSEVQFVTGWWMESLAILSLSFPPSSQVLCQTIHSNHCICWIPKDPQKLVKSHWCVPFTATFSKRRKIGALWSERCDGWWSHDGRWQATRICTRVMDGKSP